MSIKFCVPLLYKISSEGPHIPWNPSTPCYPQTPDNITCLFVDMLSGITKTSFAKRISVVLESVI